jgi:hypothetical protein
MLEKTQLWREPWERRLQYLPFYVTSRKGCTRKYLEGSGPLKKSGASFCRRREYDLRVIHCRKVDALIVDYCLARLMMTGLILIPGQWPRTG